LSRTSCALAVLVAALGLALAGEARAQVGGFPGGPGGMGGMSPPSGPPSGGGRGRSKPKPPPGTPETHAASGAEETPNLQTQEPSLPQEPLEVPEQVQKRIGSSAEGEEPPPEINERHFYGLWYSAKGPKYQFRTLFPLWAERRLPNDRASLFGLFYYNRRSPQADADVLFPLYWRLRDGQSRTTAVGPFIHNEHEATKTEPSGHMNWLPPLFFEGRSGGSGYFHIPPLLTFTRHSDHDGLNVVGPLFCKWKGGPACDSRTADEIDMGLAPLYFYGRDAVSEYELIPPLLHYYRYNDIGQSYLNVWGPYVRKHSPESDSLHVAPFFWHTWGKNEDHLTLFPFFHYGYEGNAARLVTPLFLWARDAEGESTFASWVYAHYKGRTELEMITPLYWHYKDPDIGFDRKILFPFLWKTDSPRGKELAIFPFYGRFQRYGLSDDLWITPLFRYHTDTTGWQANLFPLVHVGRSYQSTHLVLAPFVWDFASPNSRATVVLPVFFRFADRNSVSQLALNTYYTERKVPGGTDWQFHFFPFFSYGQSPTGHFWNVFYGLAGYTREGTMAKMRLAWIPIKLSE
jgi:hypothetical protein